MEHTDISSMATAIGSWIAEHALAQIVLEALGLSALITAIVSRFTEKVILWREKLTLGVLLFLMIVITINSFGYRGMKPDFHIEISQIADGTLDQSNPAQPNPSQPNPSQPNPSQPNPSQPNPSQPNPSQPNQPNSPQPNSPQPNSPQPNSPQPNSPQPNPSQANPSQANPSQAKPVFVFIFLTIANRGNIQAMVTNSRLKVNINGKLFKAQLWFFDRPTTFTIGDRTEILLPANNLGHPTMVPVGFLISGYLAYRILDAPIAIFNNVAEYQLTVTDAFGYDYVVEQTTRGAFMTHPPDD